MGHPATSKPGSRSKAADRRVRSTRAVEIPTSRKGREKWGTRQHQNQDQGQRQRTGVSAPHEPSRSPLLAEDARNGAPGNIKTRIKVKGSGQECPLHTSRQDPHFSQRTREMGHP